MHFINENALFIPKLVGVISLCSLGGVAYWMMKDVEGGWAGWRVARRSRYDAYIVTIILVMLVVVFANLEKLIELSAPLFGASRH